MFPISTQPSTPIPVILDTPEIAAFIMGAAFLSFAVQACCDFVVGGHEVVEAYKTEKAKRNA